MFNFNYVSKTLLTFFLLFSSFSFSNKVKAQVAIQDSLALVDLYNSTNGSGWTNKTNWLTTVPIKNWYGVKVKNSKVDSLVLSFNNLTGSLPTSIGNLTGLRVLWLNGNLLNGNIPNSIGSLSAIELLALNDNELAGNIPSTIGNLSKLNLLILQYNQLSGSIPASIGNLQNLFVLSLNGNKLSGAIPSSLASLPVLNYIEINTNKFTFAGMEEIVSLHPNSQYWGQEKIPITQNGNNLSVSVGGTPNNNTFKWYKDTTLVATKNGDSTFTTSGYGKYSVVVTNSICYQLTLYSDTLYPPSTNINDSLALVDLYNSTNGNGWFNKTNWLTSSPVATWYGVEVANGRVSKLFFNWADNNLVGPIPESIGNLSDLTYLNIGANKLNGSIPLSIGNLKKLEEISLWNNHLSGSLPESIGNLSSLRILNLYDNDISGTLPESIGNLTNLQTLLLTLNNFTGNIPNSFGNLSNLIELNLSNNQLSGAIPSTLNNLPLSTSLSLNYNKFTFAGLEQLLSSHTWVGYSWQAKIPVSTSNNKLYVSAGGTLANNTYKWYKDNILVATITGDSSFTLTNFGKYSVIVTNTIATNLTLFSDTILVNNLSIEVCNPIGSASLISNISGSNYQWQVSSDGILFSNISNNSNYTGANVATLQLINIPSSFYGYQYRCVVDGNNSGVYTLQFKNSWLGSPSNNDWKTASNWSCGNMPDANTDVIINSGNIVVTENASCRSLAVKPTTTVTVNPGVTLSVLH